MPVGTIDLLRKKALRILREDEATAFIISPDGREGRIIVEKHRARIAQASKQELRHFIEQTQNHLNERRRQFEIKATPSELIAFLEAAESAPPDYGFLPSIAEVRTFFSNYAKVWPDSTLLPAHARIMFDAHGVVQTGSQSMRSAFWRLPFTKTWQLFGTCYKSAFLGLILSLHRANGRVKLCFIGPPLQQPFPSLKPI